jgi:hypothetical protein
MRRLNPTREATRRSDVGGRRRPPHFGIRDQALRAEKLSRPYKSMGPGVFLVDMADVALAVEMNRDLE